MSTPDSLQSVEMAEVVPLPTDVVERVDALEAKIVTAQEEGDHRTAWRVSGDGALFLKSHLTDANRGALEPRFERMLATHRKLCAHFDAQRRQAS